MNESEIMADMKATWDWFEAQLLKPLPEGPLECKGIDHLFLIRHPAPDASPPMVPSECVKFEFRQ